ncbi:MAG TPA: DUF3341 domain-containing protein [Thermoanaerobaculia bacterium]|nr:DUF3341 domain-containing protein [Thermoanaerobaculia bacterium]
MTRTRKSDAIDYDDTLAAGEHEGIYGTMAEFATADELLAAAHAVHAAGYSKVDAYTPYPMEAVVEALEVPRSKMPLVVLCGGIVGGLTGFLLAYTTQVIIWPWNIGGRPYNSWPAFIVPTFECTILFAALSAVIGMIVLNGLPQPYHPVFNVDSFSERASSDRFFLVIEAVDPKFERGEIRRFLSGLNPSEVSEVDL